jgi:hypothetical protein
VKAALLAIKRDARGEGKTPEHKQANQPSIEQRARATQPANSLLSSSSRSTLPSVIKATILKVSVP